MFSFASDFSITGHSGTIATAMRVLGHEEYQLPTGGVIPIVIEATPNCMSLN
jgi:hypothetical protein